MTTLTSQQRQDLIDELPRLKRYCLSLTSDPADADDLLQITVERLLRERHASRCPRCEVVTQSMQELMD